jgi:hypothetical protein
MEHAESSSLSEEVVESIAIVITAAKKDPETSLLLLRMKQHADFDAFQRDLTAVQIVTGLAEALQEMEMAEMLFEQDPTKAVAEMENEGMLPPDRIKEYTKNPALLVDDVRKSLYFTFASYAAAGGYL